MDSNELRRTKEKLKTLQETPYVKQILSDMIDLTGGEYFDIERGIVHNWDTDKEWFIEEIERRYKEYIKNNTKESLKQGKIL